MVVATLSNSSSRSSSTGSKNPLKILVVGDLHGNMQVLEHLIDTNKPDLCVQLGDLAMYDDRQAFVDQVKRPLKVYEEQNFLNPDVYAPRRFNCPVLTMRGAADPVYDLTTWQKYGVYTIPAIEMYQPWNRSISEPGDLLDKLRNLGVQILSGVFSRNYTYANIHNPAVAKIVNHPDNLDRFYFNKHNRTPIEQCKVVLAQVGCSDLVEPGHKVHAEGMSLRTLNVDLRTSYHMLHARELSKEIHFVHGHHHTHYTRQHELVKNVRSLVVTGLTRARDVNPGLEKAFKILYV